MADQVVAHKYATALFGAARNLGQLDHVVEDLVALRSLGRSDPRIMEYLTSPQVRVEAKETILDRALEGRVSPVTLNFLHLVIRKKRVGRGMLGAIFDEFHELVLEYRGIVRAEVRTAVPLEPDQAARLRRDLGAMTGKTIDLEARVDPGILGGVVVAFENLIIDRSVRKGLDDLRETLMKVRVL